MHRAYVRFYCISLFQTILQQNNQQTINRVILCHVGSISMFKLVFLSFIAFPCTSFELITIFPRKNIHNDFTFVNRNLKGLYKIRHGKAMHVRSHVSPASDINRFLSCFAWWNLSGIFARHKISVTYINSQKVTRT